MAAVNSAGFLEQHDQGIRSQRSGNPTGERRSPRSSLKLSGNPAGCHLGFLCLIFGAKNISFRGPAWVCGIWGVWHLALGRFSWTFAKRKTSPGMTEVQVLVKCLGCALLKVLFRSENPPAGPQQQKLPGWEWLKHSKPSMTAILWRWLMYTFDI